MSVTILPAEGVHPLQGKTEKNGAPLVWEDGEGEHDLIYWDEHLESAFRFLASGRD